MINVKNVFKRVYWAYAKIKFQQPNLGQFLNIPWVKIWSQCFLTLEQWADFPPTSDASFTSELAQSSLQKKDGNTAAHEEDDVWNEECTLKQAHNTSSKLEYIVTWQYGSKCILSE